MSAPSRTQMIAALDEIDRSLAQDLPVHVHYWGGNGRTGTVVGCYLARHGIAEGWDAFRKANEHRRGPFYRQLYKERNRIERLINRLKQNRRLATRYEKRAENYRAMWVLGAILLWL